MSSPEQSHEPVPQADMDSRTQVLRGGGGNVDKIRDILFGTQMRDYDSRFARLEETLVKEHAEIRETSRRRFDQLESFMKKEFESIQTKFRVERDEVKELNDSLNRKLRDLDDRGSATERELRGQLLDQARELNEEVRATHDEIAAVLEKRYHELKDGKTDRAALATLFTEVALRLSDQFHIPGQDE